MYIAERITCIITEFRPISILSHVTDISLLRGMIRRLQRDNHATESSRALINFFFLSYVAVEREGEFTFCFFTWHIMCSKNTGPRVTFEIGLGVSETMKKFCRNLDFGAIDNLSSEVFREFGDWLQNLLEFLI